MEIPWPVLIFAGVALVGTYVLHFTVFGRHLFAIGGNRDAALYSGVPVKRIECSTYVISAGLAGIAGLTLHLRMVAPGGVHHSIEASFKAVARALGAAVAPNPRVGGVPSTKGSL